MWGERNVGPNEIDFEWPAQEMVDSMDPNVILKSLDLKGNEWSTVLSIKCTLSNDEQSPVF